LDEDFVDATRLILGFEIKDLNFRIRERFPIQIVDHLMSSDHLSTSSDDHLAYRPGN